MIQLTEKLLSDAGGWQAMKHARALADIGRVTEAKYAPPVLSGTVQEGDASYRAGLKISSVTNIENLCTCRESRQWGKICAHSLAVGVALLKPKAVAEVRTPAKPALEPVAGPLFASDGAGDQVMLHVVLAPNFHAAWEKGQLVASIEAVCAGRRTMLNALDAKKQFCCDKFDLRLIEKIRALNGGSVAGMLMLPREKFLELLDGLRGHPRVTFGKQNAASICSMSLKPRLLVETEAENETTLRVELPTDGKLLIAGSNAWQLRDTEFQEIAPGLPPAYHDLLQREIKLPAEQAAIFCAKELPSLRSFFEVVGEGTLMLSATVEPALPEFSFTLEGSLNHLAGRLQAIYGQRVVTIGITSRAEGFMFPNPSKPARMLVRNVPAEDAALVRLTRWDFDGPDTAGHFSLRGERQILAFFAREFPKLQRDWKVSVGSRFSNVTREIERIRPRLDVQSSGEDWFELQVSLGSQEGEHFAAAEIQRLLQLGQNSVRLKNGRLAVFDSGLLDELNDVLRDCDPKQTQPGSFRINRAHAGYLDAVASEGMEIHGTPQWQQWAGAQRQFEKIVPVPLGPLEDVLRPYQKQGVYWMNFLAQNGFGGILADEMGLGKTLQALAFLALSAKAGAGPALVVCPSSLVYNWQREAARFTPELKTLAIEGANRFSLFDRLGEVGLAITSYALLRRDIDNYRKIEFSTAILDEAQHIKNPETQNAQAATAIRARTRFVLTGTPMENSVRDLWSIMDFTMPGYLGSADEFRERFELQIRQENSGAIRQRLAKRLKPFMLRRLKKNVITELPDKIEQIAYCTLTKQQSEAYEKILLQTRKQLVDADQEKEKSKARFIMLTALLRLRQACCDLRLLGLSNIDETQASAKCELLNELLQEAIDGGHRILIFSQFVLMLRIICENLRASNVNFCYLDGQTTDRAAVVDQFQNDDQIPVFLISLKAGGVGLNLTSADTVIHFDPWWNPAVEAQATDRTHRIGQKNTVTVYKLITRGTVEEKILNLQRSKQETIDATVESEEPLMTGLSMAEIKSLLE